MVGPPQIETMMAKDVVMCNTGECVAAGKRKYQPGAVSDVPAVVPQIDPSVPQPVVQSRRRPLLGPSPG